MGYTAPNQFFLKNNIGTDSAVIAAELAKIGVELNSTTRSATIVIAASNSSAQSKAQADYVCDGVADNIKIQTTIDSLPPTGGRIILLDGTFNIIDNINMRSYLTLEGQGFSTIIKISNSVYKNIINAISVNGVNIKNIQLDGNKTNNTSQANVLIQNGLYLENCTNSVFDCILVQNCTQNGVYAMPITGATGPNLMYNQFSKIISLLNGQSGIYFDSYAEYNTVSNCQFNNNGKYGIACCTANTAFTNCIAIQNTESGIAIIQASKSSNNSFVGCHANHNIKYGFRIVGAAQTVINACKSIANMRHGVSLEGAIQNSITNNTVTTNCFDSTGYDNIHLDATSTGNIISGNSILRQSGAAEYGINEGTGANYNLFQGNIIGTHVTSAKVISGANSVDDNNLLLV